MPQAVMGEALNACFLAGCRETFFTTFVKLGPKLLLLLVDLR
jgi:hypothetical protein